MQIVILLLVICTLASATFAQSLFDFSSKKPSNNTASTSTPNVKVNPVVSPSDFKKKVNTLYNQQQNQLKQEVKQQLSPSALPTPLPTTPPAATTTLPKQPVAPSTNAPMTLPAAPTATPSSDSFSSYGNQPAATSPTTPGVAPAQTGSQPYTGFGTVNTNTNNNVDTKPNPNSTAPNSGNTNGWNIKY